MLGAHIILTQTRGLFLSEKDHSPHSLGESLPHLWTSVFPGIQFPPPPRDLFHRAETLDDPPFSLLARCPPLLLPGHAFPEMVFHLAEDPVPERRTDSQRLPQ